MKDNTMIIGVFSNRTEAENAINELHEMDYDAKDISVITKSQDDAEVIHENTGSPVAEGAATGATTGGIIGGLTGLLIGIGAIAIPGIGALLIGGPLAAALGLTGAAATTATGALTGALAGGLVGALVSLGIPEEDARVYEEHVKEGGILIAVPAGNRDSTEVKEILKDNNAERIRSFSMNDQHSQTTNL